MPRVLLCLLPALLLALPAAPLAAQGNGATLLARVDDYGGYNDCWGYSAPDGREYAIIGTGDGTAFYNATDPRNPYLVGFIPGPGSLWRDMKTWDQYCYVVTEGGGGVQIISLADPENPFLVKTWGDTIFSRAHNIAIDTGAGVAYVCGTNNDMPVLDLSDPENPVNIGNYRGAYVHDLHVQNGIAHLAEIYNGKYRLADAASLSFSTYDSAVTPGQFTHNAWANETGTLAVTTDESGNGHLTLWDISNPNNIFIRDEWLAGNNTTIHNAYIRGDRAYASYYTEGIVVLDISNPDDIRFVAGYDTSSFEAGSGYEGCWGIYPFAPSGVVYASDMAEGLHILQIDGQAMSIGHTPLADTTDETGPYPLTATVTSLNGAAVTSAEAWYRVDQGSWQLAPLAPSGNPDEWTGSIPGVPSPAIVEYYLVAENELGDRVWEPVSTLPGESLHSFIVGTQVQVFFDDFEGPTDNGWTHGMVSGEDDWERGTPAGRSGSTSRHEGVVWYDPDAAFSGSKVWANDLGNGSSDGAYSANVENWLQSPPIDCSASTHTTLKFMRWLTVEGADYDFARILVNDTLVWENPRVNVPSGDSFDILDAYWRQQTVDISSIADGNPSVVIRFELKSDLVKEMGGWALDDVSVVGIQGDVVTDSIQLTGPSTAQAGGTVTLDIASAPPNAPYTVLYAFSLTGSLIDGHPFDLGSPSRTAGTGVTDAQGAATWTSPPIPAAGAGRTAYLEIRADAGGEIFDSNPLTLDIQ